MNNLFFGAVCNNLNHFKTTDDRSKYSGLSLGALSALPVPADSDSQRHARVATAGTPLACCGLTAGLLETSLGPFCWALRNVGSRTTSVVLVAWLGCSLRRWGRRALVRRLWSQTWGHLPLFSVAQTGGTAPPPGRGWPPWPPLTQTLCSVPLAHEHPGPPAGAAGPGSRGQTQRGHTHPLPALVRRPVLQRLSSRADCQMWRAPEAGTAASVPTRPCSLGHPGFVSRTVLLSYPVFFQLHSFSEKLHLPRGDRSAPGA